MTKIGRVLLVDDDEVGNFLVARLFKLYDEELELIICLNGKEALEYLETSEILPDIIL